MPDFNLIQTTFFSSNNYKTNRTFFLTLWRLAKEKNYLCRLNFDEVFLSDYYCWLFLETMLQRHFAWNLLFIIIITNHIDIIIITSKTTVRWYFKQVAVAISSTVNTIGQKYIEFFTKRMLARQIKGEGRGEEAINS